MIRIIIHAELIRLARFRTLLAAGIGSLAFAVLTTLTGCG